jgi:alpha-tubulin suppressor-like RCC1 family protein
VALFCLVTIWVMTLPGITLLQKTGIPLAACLLSMHCRGGEPASSVDGDLSDKIDAGYESPDAALPVKDCAVKSLALGAGHSCALDYGGSVWCWGSFPNLGVCEPGDSPLAWRVDLGAKATEVSSDQDHTCAVLEDTSIACWGWNALDQCGSGLE